MSVDLVYVDGNTAKETVVDSWVCKPSHGCLSKEMDELIYEGEDCFGVVSDMLSGEKYCVRWGHYYLKHT